jgi:integration host factor beta subunit
MTKSELINRVAERLPYLTRKDAEIIVNTIFDSMVDALVEGDRIEIRGFGSFKVKNRGDREGRNPKTGESVKIPAKRMPFFKIGKELYERINQEAASLGAFPKEGEGA